MLSHQRIKKTGVLLVAATLSAVAQPSPQQPKMSPNPFLSAYATPHQTAPFDKVKNTDYLPALTEGLAQGRKEVAAIVNSTDKPTFENTIVALERAGDLLGKVTSVLFNLNSAETTPELQKIVKEASPMLSEYGNDITLNEKLFARIKSVYDQRASLKLDPERSMLLEKAYKRFARNGANLDATGKERLRAIDKEMSQLSLQFGENVLNETNEFMMPVTNEKDLAGLPDFVREAAKATAKQKGKEGYVFTLQAPSYGPFMQYADNRSLREKLYMAYNGRGFHGDKNDNSAIIEKIVNLRYERANLLGYKTHADFVLEESMAGSRDKVQSFLDELVTYARPAAERQLAELTTYAKAHGFADDKLQVWDNNYYAEKLKKEKYDLDDEMLKPYFKLDNVLNGAFTVANKLYGITFKERTDIPVYNPEVKTFDVFDKDGKFLAVFYGDYFPRAGKRSGAWMNDIQGQKVENGTNIRPHIVNVCNFTRPTDTKPSLLTFYEVTTLFHEFGHGLHGMLANGTFESLSGTSVPRDFVELPSQVMENWCYDPEALKLFARHYQTGEVIPNELIEKIRASQNFLAGLANLRQLRLGLTDMYYHGQKPTGESITEVENRVDSVANLFPRVKGVAVSPAFSHIFAGGYSAGYYSYKWSEVLDADAFEFFKEKGGLENKTAADSFRKNVLEKGGTEKPMELYKKFRGREPSPKAMLRRSGLIL
ncbi:M3 family metallopeptidase [Spirosoma utsteinense]|uniref:Peptidyl-dipeptidase Dcp n=1 Tax=Spirosoma utsteinense TaxID=2585773 RepID=A0ABR6VZM9_9BACT|nr:peptidyl-dipeptidase Dcp [Spirosoma utsteinense]MBC3789729.1 peptidyl-dipeptidase Dcp [Spirosoma utsteinense]